MKRSRLGWVAAAAVVLAVVAIGLAYSGRHSPAAGDGPVRFLSDGSVSVTGYHAEVGSTVVFGPAVVHNDNDSPLRLSDARLVGDVPEAGAVVRQVLALDPQRTGGSLVGVGNWPDRHIMRNAKPVEDYVLQPGADAELLFVVTAKGDGSWQWPETEVTYVAGEATYTERASVGVEMCVPSSRRC